MKKFIIIIFSLVAISTFLLFFLFYKTVKLPDINYDHACLLSLNDKIDSNYNKPILVYEGSGTNGESFIDEKGNPIHKYYTKTILSKNTIKNIHSSLNRFEFSTLVTSCIPMYRDVIIYYDKNDKPIAWLSICFECWQIYYLPNNISDGGSTLFKNLENEFNKIRKQ